MDISSEEFINFYSIAVHPKPSQISPICISPFTSTDQSLHVQVIPTPKPTSEASQSDYPTYKIIKDENCFYQISTYNLMTLVQKISQNRCLWNIPAFFPSKFVAASLSNELLFIGLSDKTINIVDTNTGICCFPSVFVEDKIIYLISEDNYVICFTSNNMLTIWEIVNNQYLRSIIQEKYEGPALGDIQKVTLTNELENDSISPIIFAENITVRFSKTRNGWINANCNIPAIFGKLEGYRTIYDVEKGFFKSLINDEIEEFHNCMTILLQKYLKSERFNRVNILVMQLLDIIGSGKTSYCGMNPKELLEFMLKIIGETHPELVDTIVKSPEYYDAFNPKPVNPPPPPPPPQPKEIPQEIPQSSIALPSNSNITPEQQEVINILFKNQQNQQTPASIITQPNIISPEQQNQNESFIWPNSNSQIQIPTQTAEIPIQEPQEPTYSETNEVSNFTNEPVITFPNTTDESLSPPKVKSYNEDDGLTRAQKYVSESLPAPIFNEELPPVRHETKKKNTSPAQINALDIVSSEAAPATPQKASASSPSKQPKKRTLKQGTLADFIQISPRKSDQKKSENQIVEEKKTKSSPKRKSAASQNTIQLAVQFDQDEAEAQKSNKEQEDDSQSSLQKRRSPRTPKKLAADNSPEPKKKTTRTQKKKGKKAIENENEEEDQEQQHQIEAAENENENIQQETETQKKTPNRRASKKTNKKTPTKAIDFFLNENETTEQSATQQPLPVLNSTDQSQNLQPSATSEEPNIQQFQQTQPIQQNQQVFQQQQQPNIQQYQMQISPILLNDPTFQSNQVFKMLHPQIQSQIIEYQKQHNITPKRKARAKAKNLSQTTQISPIQSQQNPDFTQQEQLPQSAEIISPTLQSTQLQNEEQQQQEEQTDTSQIDVKIEKKTKSKPRKKPATKRKTKNSPDEQQEQQEQGDQITIPEDEFITSMETQEDNASSSAPLQKQKTTRTRGRKANSKSQENNEDENNEEQNQTQKKRKSPARSRKKKDDKAISQAPQLSIQNDDEKLSAPAFVEQNKLTIDEAQEMAEKMQQDNQ